MSEIDRSSLERHLPKETMALVLAGGRGSRLKQLTDVRAKPAVYFGGHFRIIDFVLSNCMNSGLEFPEVRDERICRPDPGAAAGR